MLAHASLNHRAWLAYYGEAAYCVEVACYVETACCVAAAYCVDAYRAETLALMSEPCVAESWREAASNPQHEVQARSSAREA